MACKPLVVADELNHQLTVANARQLKVPDWADALTAWFSVVGWFRASIGDT